MTRLERKSRTDIHYMNSGGLFDAFDDVIKSVWRINDEEYDYICETATDEELMLLIDEKLTFGNAKKAISLVNNLIKQFNQNSYKSHG